MNRGTSTTGEKGETGQQMPTMNSTAQLKNNGADVMALAKQMEKGR